MDFRRSLMALIPAVCLFAEPPPASAQTPPKPVIKAVAKPSAAQQKAAQEAQTAQKQFAQGIALMRANKMDAALPLFQQVVAKFPKVAPAYTNMAVIYRSRNDFGNAEAMAKKALAITPNDPNSLRTLGDVYLTQKRWTDAASVLRRASRATPADSRLHLVLAQTEYKIGNKSAAETQYRAAVSTAPKDVMAERALVGFYSAEGRQADFARELKTLALLQPKDPQVLFDLGISEARASHPKEALALFRRVLAINPANKPAAMNAARLELQLGQTAAATATFRQILKTNPKDPEAHFALGIEAFQQKKYPAAEKEFRSVLASSPKGKAAIPARINLGLALANENKVKDATPIFQQVIAEDPKNVMALTQLASIYARQGQFGPANDIYKKIVDIEPNNVPALQSLAFTSQFSGDANASRDAYERIHKLQPNDENAIAMLANSYVGDKDLDKAVALYAPLLKKDKKYHEEIARLYTQANKKDQAVAELKTWTAEAPKNPLAWEALGDTYRDQAKMTDARAAYESAKSIDPKSAAPYQRIAESYQREGKQDDALKELATVPKGAKDAVGAYRLAATIYEGQSKFAEAADQYRLAAAQDPKDSFTAANVPRLLLAANKTDDAVTEYQSLIKRFPKDPTLQNGLGKALEKKGDQPGAIAAYREAGKLQPQDTQWARDVARIQESQGMGKAAVKTLADVYAKNPNDIPTATAMIDSADKSDDLDTAIAALTKVAQTGPTNAAIYNTLATAYERKDLKTGAKTTMDGKAPASGLEVLKNYARQFPTNDGAQDAVATYAKNRGHLDEAATALKVLTKRNPDDTAHLSALADVLDQTKDEQGAIDAYTDLARHEVYSAAPHRHLAHIYEDQGRPLDARAEWQIADRLEPGDLDTQKALIRLHAPIGAAPVTVPEPQQPTTPGQTPKGLEGPAAPPPPWARPTQPMIPTVPVSPGQ